MYKLIIWDWNGTLLDDAHVCIGAMNPLLQHRNLQLINEERYAELFSFPVRDYYKLLGFDLINEDFAVPAMEFMHRYIGTIGEAGLREGSQEVIHYFRNAGISQLILSAMEQELLLRLVNNHGLSHLIDGIYGITDHFGEGKTEAALRLMKERRIGYENTVLIGDTIHDMEVAETIGCKCIILPSGHQSAQRLKQEAKKRKGIRMIAHLSELPEIIY
jgi:phosphoglycolate phosphatase